MGRIYSSGFTAQAISVATDDVFQVTAPSDAVVIIHSLSIAQSSSETSDQIGVTIQRATGTGTGGTTVTARPMQIGDTAFGGTTARNHTTQATTLTELHYEAFNVLGGFRYLPAPDSRIVVSPSGIIVVRFEDAPVASTNFDLTIVFEEIGG